MQLSDPTRTIAPTREDPVARGASEWLGGPVGRYAAIGRRGLRPALVALSCLATVTMALAVALRSSCLTYGWRAGDQFWHMCYSDIPVVYQGSPLADGAFAYDGTRGVGQPAGTGVAMWLLSMLVPGGPEKSRTLAAAQTYFGLWAVLGTILLVLMVVLLVRAMPARRWSVAHLALSPVVLLVSLVSFDLLAVTLAVAGLVAWGRRRPLQAGLLLGLAATCRTPAVLLLVGIGLVCVRAGRVLDWLVSLAAATLAALVVIGGVVVVSGTQALAVYRDWTTAQPGYGSVPYLLTSLGVTVPAGLMTICAVAGWVLAVGLAALLALGSARRPAVAEVCLVLVVVVGITGRTMPLQLSLWLVPLLALIGVRWRDHLVWAGVEALYFGAVWLHIAAGSAPDRGLPAGWFAVFSAARILAWAWLAWTVTRQARSRVPEAEVDPGAAVAGSTGRPDHDPLAGVASGAPDRVLLEVV